MRKILVTNALPYANGELHLGHILGYVSSDIWTRYQKMIGNECYSICGSDMHGTPIMLAARSQNIEPEKLANSMEKQHKIVFESFNIYFDQYHSTHNKINQDFIENIFVILNDKELITEKVLKQAFDIKEEMFLPDRFVKGTCPICQTNNQYGDSCDNCGANYSPSELLDIKSSISNTTPIFKETKHFFFKVSVLKEALTNWSKTHLKPEVFNITQKWLDQGLQDWAISRDAPYYGFVIPGTNAQKYFYVWLDATIGYLACFQALCNMQNIDFNEYWHKGSNAEIHQYIGKDITYFHTLFWPALLLGIEYRLPTSIRVHGFLTVNKRKMSKSKNTFILAKDYLTFFPSEYLRYYFACKITDKIDDLDFDILELQTIINNCLIAKILNIGSRCSKILSSYFENKLSIDILEDSSIKEVASLIPNIHSLYEKGQFSLVMQNIHTIADITNYVINKYEPWNILKSNKDLAHQVCSLGLNHFRILIHLLKPIIPNLAQQVEKYYNLSFENWHNINLWLTNWQLGSFEKLASKITDADVRSFQERYTVKEDNK